jgi:hypothetical protein
LAGDFPAVDFSAVVGCFAFGVPFALVSVPFTPAALFAVEDDDDLGGELPQPANMSPQMVPENSK